MHKNLKFQFDLSKKAVAEKDPGMFLAIHLGGFVLLQQVVSNWHLDLLKAFPSQQYLGSEQGVKAICDKIDTLAPDTPSAEWVDKVKQFYTAFISLDLDFYHYYAFGYKDK